jgi:hypothetical protein
VEQLRVLVALAGAMLLAGCSVIVPLVGMTTPTSGAVPWVAATAGPMVTASPEAIPTGTPPCDISRLGVVVTAGAGGGTVEGLATFTHPSDAWPCFLAGPPKSIGIRLEQSGRTVPVQYDVRARPGPGDKVVRPSSPVTLDAEAQAQDLFIWSNWCGDPDAKIRFVFRTTTGSGAASGISNATYGAPRCDQPGLPTRITGYAFRAPPTEEVSMDVALDVPATAIVGQRLEYAVTISNHDVRPARLDPCPEYQEGLVLPKPPGPHVERWALNCEALPDVLWPGDRRRLAMQIAVPSDASPGPGTITWMFFSDAVEGTADAPIQIVGS